MKSPPACLMKGVDDYRVSGSSALQWLRECTVKGDEHRVLQQTLYNSYRRFCEENGYKDPGAGNFSRALTRLTGTKTPKRSRKGKTRTGIGLNAEGLEMLDRKGNSGSFKEIASRGSPHDRARVKDFDNLDPTESIL